MHRRGWPLSFIRGDEWLAHPGSVGKLIDADVMVVDENHQRLPAGEVGELYFRSFSGSHGFRYVGGAEIRHLPGGYVSIGDLGWVDAGGYLISPTGGLTWSLRAAPMSMSPRSKAF